MEHPWPAFNACLNATSGILVSLGFYFIKGKRIEPHKRCMIAACWVSGLFLISYVVYHSFHGTTRFPGSGAIRTVYLSILLSHTLLALSLVPMVFVTLRRALKGDLARHRRIARWTFPLWLYVSITGVIVYLMLYQL